MKVFSPKNIRVTSGSGAAVLVHANEPRDVPIWAVPKILAKGGRLVDETRDVSSVVTHIASIEQLIETLQTMIEDGNPDNFTKSGRPRIDAVRAIMAPLDVVAKDVAEAFDAVMKNAGDQ